MSIESLRKHYDSIVESEKTLREEKQSLFDNLLSLAKYKPRDKVVWKGTPGIVRGLKVLLPDCKGPLRIGYFVGKVTKSGEMHKSHDIHYWPIPEEELSDGE